MEEEATRLKGSLAKAEEKASLTKHQVSEAAAEAIEAYRKGKHFSQKLLDSCQHAYTKGSWWHRRKVAKYYSDINLGVLSSRRSSFGSEFVSSVGEEGGKATSPTFKLLFCFWSSCFFVKGLLSLL